MDYAERDEVLDLPRERFAARLVNNPVPVPDGMWPPVATLALRAVGDNPVNGPAGSFARLLQIIALRATFHGGLRCEVPTAIGNDGARPAWRPLRG